MARTIRLLATAGALAALALGCGDDAEPVPRSATEAGRWSDIDTRYPSEDLVATVYGYVQAMAAGDEDRACSFQYRGSSDHAADPCLLADEMPRRDKRRSAGEWERLATHPLDDYVAEEDHGWKVSLPTEPVTWRITQDDAGIWFID